MLLPPSAGAGDQLHVSDQRITDHSCTACSITKGQKHIDPLLQGITIQALANKTVNHLSLN